MGVMDLQQHQNERQDLPTRDSAPRDPWRFGQNFQSTLIFKAATPSSSAGQSMLRRITPDRPRHRFADAMFVMICLLAIVSNTCASFAQESTTNQVAGCVSCWDLDDNTNSVESRAFFSAQWAAEDEGALPAVVFPLIPEPNRLRVIPDSAATTPWDKGP